MRFIENKAMKIQVGCSFVIQEICNVANILDSKRVLSNACKANVEGMGKTYIFKQIEPFDQHAITIHKNN